MNDGFRVIGRDVVDLSKLRARGLAQQDSLQ